MYNCTHFDIGLHMYTEYTVHVVQCTGKAYPVDNGRHNQIILGEL